MAFNKWNLLDPRIPLALPAGVSIPIGMWAYWLWQEYWQLINQGSFSVRPDLGMPFELTIIPVALIAFVGCFIWLAYCINHHKSKRPDSARIVWSGSPP